MEKERDPLNLRSLPLVAPPADDWPAVRNALAKQNRRRRAARYATGVLALAATVALVVGLVVLRPVPGVIPQDDGARVAAHQDGSAVPAAGGVLETGTDSLSPDALIALSQQLEARIRSIRSEVGGLPTRSLVYQVELEDLIAQVDDELSMNPQSAGLWGQRISLLMDLNELYQNELRRDYHRMASL